MSVLQAVLILATFLCSLVSGFLFAFAVVVMPGIRDLNDKEFIRAFQVMDGVIQNNQPLFMLVWIGSVVALLSSVVLGIGQMDGTGHLLITCAAIVYLFGVQLPTIVINIPLNNRLRTYDVDNINETAHKKAREEFELRWNRWNLSRTVFSSLASVLLMILLFRL